MANIGEIYPNFVKHSEVLSLLLNADNLNNLFLQHVFGLPGALMMPDNLHILLHIAIVLCPFITGL